MARRKRAVIPPPVTVYTRNTVGGRLHLTPMMGCTTVVHVIEKGPVGPKKGC